RLATLAQDAAPVTQTPLSVESDELGESSVRFDVAYYDGQSLLVGIVMENTSRIEPFTPTEEELAAMEPVEDGQMPSPLAEGADAEVIAAFGEAMEQGRPYGFARYTVYPSDHITTGDGVDVGPSVGWEALSDDGLCLQLREMETPLPEEIQDRDQLELHLKTWQSVSRYWFDGETLYMGSERSQAGEAVCTVTRSEASFATYAGEGEYNGTPVSLTLSLSALHGDLTVAAEGDAFPAGPDHDTWYDVILLDEDGYALQELENGVDLNYIRASYDGLGRLPESLTAYIVIETEGDWDRDAALAAAQPISLTAQK
ncbi:MAG: hypothetical protein IJ048_13175, partial [Clostridia bacterium]|nr:hypothetical protein [Clostridia bacterium]